MAGEGDNLEHLRDAIDLETVRVHDPDGYAAFFHIRAWDTMGPQEVPAEVAATWDEVEAIVAELDHDLGGLP